MPTIEQREQEMLEVIKALGPGWHDRNAMAAHLGKKMLNPQQTMTLDLLASKGVIEKMQEATHREHIYHWLYRLPESSTDTPKKPSRSRAKKG